MGGEAGKGDKRRPLLITIEEWDRAWNETFLLPPLSRSVIIERDPGDENDYKQK